jgi:hypothetical protein
MRWEGFTETIMGLNAPPYTSAFRAESGRLKNVDYPRAALATARIPWQIPVRWGRATRQVDVVMPTEDRHGTTYPVSTSCRRR